MSLSSFSVISATGGNSALFRLRPELVMADTGVLLAGMVERKNGEKLFSTVKHDVTIKSTRQRTHRSNIAFLTRSPNQIRLSTVICSSRCRPRTGSGVIKCALDLFANSDRPSSFALSQLHQSNTCHSAQSQQLTNQAHPQLIAQLFPYMITSIRLAQLPWSRSPRSPSRQRNRRYSLEVDW